MKIPRDLYYILSQSRLLFGGDAEQGFVAPPWCLERSVQEKLYRLGEKDLPFEQVRLESEGACCLRYPPDHEESAFIFHAPIGSEGVGGIEPWDAIEFEAYAYHAGDEQPLRLDEVRRREEDLDFMRIPIGRVEIPHGANFHTLTECDFDSVVGQMQKPISLTWWNRVDHEFRRDFPYAGFSDELAKKIELLQECMRGVRITDPGPWDSKKEAVQSLTRLLHYRKFSRSKSDESFFWAVLDPFAYIQGDGPGPRRQTARTVLHIPSKYSDTDDEQTAEIRLVAVHEGDKEPIPVAKDKDLSNGDTGLMQMPLGYIGWRSTERRQGIFEQPADWTWSEDWEEPSGWAWADGWEEPIELTWRNVTGYNEDGDGRALTQKYIFLRHYLKQVYIVSMGEGVDERAVVRTLEDLAGIKLRQGSNSLGEDYWWKVQYGGPTLGGHDSYNKSSSRPSGNNRNSGSPSALDIYGGNKQRAHDHYWNTN